MLCHMFLENLWLMLFMGWNISFMIYRRIHIVGHRIVYYSIYLL